MPQEKPAFFVEFFRNPLTEAYPEVFQPLGDGIELTRWWLGHDDPRRCSLFSLFAIRHENRWGLDAVRNSVLDVDTRIYLGVIQRAVKPLHSWGGYKAPMGIWLKSTHS